MNECVEHPCYYAVLDANVRYDKRLTSSEKLLYAEISALTNASGKCTAKNKYFAELYQQGLSTISRWVSNLAKCGYIKIDGEGKSRVITLFKNAPTFSKMRNEPTQKREGFIKYILNNKYYYMNITRENNNAHTRDSLPSNQKVSDEFDEVYLSKVLSSKQLQFHKAFPTKALNTFDGKFIDIPKDVDMDALINKINESSFLKSLDNIGLRACCITLYPYIMADAYKDFNPNKIKTNKIKKKLNLVGREYEDGELNDLFNDIDDIVF